MHSRMPIPCIAPQSGTNTRADRKGETEFTLPQYLCYEIQDQILHGSLFALPAMAVDILTMGLSLRVSELQLSLC